MNLKPKAILAYIIMSNGAIVNPRNNGDIICNGRLPHTKSRRANLHLEGYCCYTPCFKCGFAKYLDKIFYNKKQKGS